MTSNNLLRKLNTQHAFNEHKILISIYRKKYGEVVSEIILTDDEDTSSFNCWSQSWK